MATVKGNPDWLKASTKTNKKGQSVLILRGDNSWAGQPVIDTVTIKLSEHCPTVQIDRAMVASWRITGGEGKNTFHFQSQAGAITKRKTSVIKMGNNGLANRFIFTNDTKSHGPFNHMQQFVLREFGPKDLVLLKNIGRTFRLDDLRRDGEWWVFPGVPSSNLKVYPA